MGTPFLGELRIVTFNFAPKGWALANGQTLSIQQNTALFSLLGTTYGGNGTTTFSLPNLQGMAATHFGGVTPTLGAAGGEAFHTLIPNELPSHTHLVTVGSTTAKQLSPSGGTWAATANGLDLYAATPNTTMAGSVVAPSSGGGQPHENRPPFLVANVIIALLGIFPSRN